MVAFSCESFTFLDIMVDVFGKMKVSGGIICIDDTLVVLVGRIDDFVGEMILGTFNGVLVGRRNGRLSESCFAIILGVFIGSVVGVD